jgi:hypothetical protein
MAKRASTMRKELSEIHGANQEDVAKMSDDEVRVKFEEITMEEQKDAPSDLCLFYDNEKATKNGVEYVKINGLRRVAQDKIGTIIDQHIETSPIFEEGKMSGAIATMTITFLQGDLRRTFSDAADCRPYYNSGWDFGKYSVSSAVTRAEARIYRKALNLNIVAAEEVMDSEEEEVVTNSQPTTDLQKRIIEKFISDNKTTLKDVLVAIKKEPVDDISLLNFESAREIIKSQTEIKEYLKGKEVK